MHDLDVVFLFLCPFHSDVMFAARYFLELSKNKHLYLLLDFSEFSQISFDQDPIPSWPSADCPATTMHLDVHY